MSKTKDQIQGEALKVILPLKRCSVAISMGVGKTLIGLKYLHNNYTEFSRFLVAVPKISVIEEWRKQAKEFGLEYLLPHIEFTTYVSLQKSDMDYDVLVLDECHNLLPNKKEWLDRFTGNILGMTGTPPKNKNSVKYKLIDKYCPIVYRYTLDEGVEDSLLNNYRIIIYKTSLDEKKNIEIKKKDKVWFTSEKASYDYWTAKIDETVNPFDLKIIRVMRMKALMGFPKKERLAAQLMGTISDKCILFANTHMQAEKLCAHTYHSKNKKSEENLELFNQGIYTKLGCVLQLSEGINIKHLKEAIIMHAYGNERKLPQRLGRTMRLKPNETATIRILCYKDTVDEEWVNTALKDFDQTKIKVIEV